MNQCWRLKPTRAFSPNFTVMRSIGAGWVKYTSGTCLFVFQAPAPISPLCCLMRRLGFTVNLQDQEKARCPISVPPHKRLSMA